MKHPLPFRRLTFALLLAVFLPAALSAKTGKVFDNLTVKSEILGMDRKYAVYLPPDYESSERDYPVLYLLHGGGDDQTGWVQFGEVLRITDQAINDGTATPMIIVMPDASATFRGFFNDLTNTWRYEDFIFDEFIPHVEDKFRIKGTKRFRAISGLSMGGGGTFMYALHRPDMFSSAAPMSAATGPTTATAITNRIERHSIDPEQAVTPEQLESYFQQHSAVYMAEHNDLKELQSVRWLIDCGDGDFLSVGNAQVHIALTQRKVPHEYRVRDGGHNWTYWRDSLPHVLKFISDSFHQH
jgi:enterochelin esterase-like enzyme